MNLKKKKYKYKYKILLIILILLIVFTLFYFFINDKEKDNFFTNTLKDITSYISKITSFSFFNDTNYNKDLIKELNNDYKKEIEALKDTLNLNKLNSDKKLINCIVTKRSLNYYYDIITIDKGKKDNIEVGSAVINKNGLLGKIIKVNNYSSEVKLLTSLNKDDYISSSFKYDNKDYFGIIKDYDYKNNTLTMIDVIGELNKDTLIGENVVTSPISNKYSSGLLIGKIKDIKKDTFGISNIIIITPTVNFNNINIVSVVGVKND